MRRWERCRTEIGKVSCIQGLARTLNDRHWMERRQFSEWSCKVRIRIFLRWCQWLNWNTWMKIRRWARCRTEIGKVSCIQGLARTLNDRHWMERRQFSEWSCKVSIRIFWEVCRCHFKLEMWNEYLFISLF
jgi:hypothetical protein